MKIIKIIITIIIITIHLNSQNITCKIPWTHLSLLQLESKPPYLPDPVLYLYVCSLADIAMNQLVC